MTLSSSKCRSSCHATENHISCTSTSQERIISVTGTTTSSTSTWWTKTLKGFTRLKCLWPSVHWLTSDVSLDPRKPWFLEVIRPSVAPTKSQSCRISLQAQTTHSIWALASTKESICCIRLVELDISGVFLLRLPKRYSSLLLTALRTRTMCRR